LNKDGSLDEVFRTAFKTKNFRCRLILVQPNGKILVSGDEHAVQTRIWFHAVYRLNPDGMFDLSFVPVDMGVSLGRISVMALQSDGKILIGMEAEFQNFISLIRKYPNGTLDKAFNKNFKKSYEEYYARGSKSNAVKAILLQGNGDIIIGCNSDRPNVAKIHKDGSFDKAFLLNIADGYGYGVYDLIQSSDGTIVAVGGFDRVVNVRKAFPAEWNACKKDNECEVIGDSCKWDVANVEFASEIPMGMSQVYCPPGKPSKAVCVKGICQAAK
jgi:hypothetical protein